MWLSVPSSSTLPGVMRNLNGLFSGVLSTEHSGVMEWPMYRSSSRLRTKQRYFSSFLDSLVLAAAKKWFFPTNQSPRHENSLAVLGWVMVVVVVIWWELGMVVMRVWSYGIGGDWMGVTSGAVCTVVGLVTSNREVWIQTHLYRCIFCNVLCSETLKGVAMKGSGLGIEHVTWHSTYTTHYELSHHWSLPRTWMLIGFGCSASTF